MIFRQLLVCVAALMIGAPAAHAQDWIVRGAGFGHGVGMSQYGAYGMAQQGAGYRRILGHYYRGTAIANVGGRTIRVILRDGERGRLSFSGAARIGRRRADPLKRYTAVRVPGRIVHVRGVGRFRAPLVVRGGSGGVRLTGRAMNGVSDGRYRGVIELSPHAEKKLAAVNALPVDLYVQGVVAGEMPSSWDLEALKVQAVAARTYSQTTDAGGELYDQYPDQRSQVYRGIAGETARSNAAVRGTRGEILSYRGRPAVTYYSSTSGGQTESVEYGFPGGTPTGYLRSVRDPADRISPYHRWAVRFSRRTLQRRLRGVLRGRFRGVRVVRRGVSPRVVAAEVVGSRGRTRVSGDAIRDRLGLRSTWFRFARR
ncbi:MAG TPA: SpoIID/LytB domain-containing protein [Solirubrobacteraceae bacterium]